MGRTARGALLLSVGLLLVGARDTCHPSGSARVYALSADSVLAQGCFAPLACPVTLSEDLGGTFRLRLLSTGDRFDLYGVRDVYWLARIQGEDIPITGSGTYLDGAEEDRLVLALRIGDEVVQVFDSGRVPSGPPGAREIVASVSLHGQSYFDTVIEIHALAFPDTRALTPCGPTGPSCEPETEICVARTPVGPATVYGCEPVPTGCQQDRSCRCAGSALCGETFHVCTELGDNELQCECPECQ